MARFCTLPWATRKLMRNANFDPEIGQGDVAPTEVARYMTKGALIWIVAVIWAGTLAADIYLMLGADKTGLAMALELGAIFLLLLPATWTLERALLLSMPPVPSARAKFWAVGSRVVFMLGSAIPTVLTIAMFSNGQELDLRNRQNHLNRVATTKAQLQVSSGLDDINKNLFESRAEESKLKSLLDDEGPTPEIASLLQTKRECSSHLTALQASLRPQIEVLKERLSQLDAAEPRYQELALQRDQYQTRLANKRQECDKAAQTYQAEKTAHSALTQTALNAVRTQVSEQVKKQGATTIAVGKKLEEYSAVSAAAARPQFSSRSSELLKLIADETGVRVWTICYLLLIAGIEMSVVLFSMGHPTVHQFQQREREDEAILSASEASTRARMHLLAAEEYWQSDEGRSLARNHVQARAEEAEITERIQRRARQAGTAARAYTTVWSQSSGKAATPDIDRDAAEQLRKELAELAKTDAHGRTPA